MPYALEYEVPADAAFYNRVKEGVGEERPHGLLAHIVTETPRGLRHLGVWDTKQDWDRFREERVEPALEKALAEVGRPGRPPQPPTQELRVVDVILGG